MRTDEFDYELPPELIAQAPAEKRDESRMMVLHRAGGTIEHRRFSDLPEYLAANDLLVLNDTRVIPARLFANKTREGTGGGKVEFLLLEELPVAGLSPVAMAGGMFTARWSALMRCRRRPQPGESVRLNDGETNLTIEEDLGEGKVILRATGKRPFREAIAAVGIPPLPPYIHRKGATEEQRARDILRYQTIYAAHPGAVAAPTAGLHFTPEVFAALGAKGVSKAFVTLHVGIGTFRPVTSENVEDHRMEEERWTLPAETADAIRRARAAGGRIVAVGSTTVRTLETAAAEQGVAFPREGAGRTGIFIRPPYAFRTTDAMLTNFHLPKSTLIMMVSALAGREFVLEAYREAVRERYRFYSYGDCMLIL
jgi:S-adenosylmethionine:tRNA ribosyltransferase-isomerase